MHKINQSILFFFINKEEKEQKEKKLRLPKTKDYEQIYALQFYLICTFSFIYISCY